MMVGALLVTRGLIRQVQMDQPLLLLLLMLLLLLLLLLVLLLVLLRA